MSRPEPCVLFSQTFAHPHLDEYVDEVIFAEPIVITACEFLEQSSSSVSSAVTLLGATSPPSFALEVFVQCEGETRFRRLCHPFLYSHSSSNVLEVEAVVTSHLVVRGSYRSLSLVIYGNTAEDLGQFNIEVDLDSSLTSLVFSPEGKLDDLPPALRSRDLSIEEAISSLNALSLPAAPSDVTIIARQLLHLTFKILEVQSLGEATIQKIVNTVASAASYFATSSLRLQTSCQIQSTRGAPKVSEEPLLLVEARKFLLDLLQELHETGSTPTDFLADCTFLESKDDLATSKQLMDMFSNYFCISKNFSSDMHHHQSQNMDSILLLSVALILCSAKEGCFHFVDGGGMKHIASVFSDDTLNSTATTLMLLGFVEQATRYSVGCEGFLGWWPREDELIPPGISKGYNQLLKLLLEKQRHDVASLSTYVLHRLRLYEVASRYECAVLSLLGVLSAVNKVTSLNADMLASAKLQLKSLLKLINTRDPIEDPSPVAVATRSLILGQVDGFLSYKATHGLIASSKCRFSSSDIDSHLLSLLKETGFLPLSVALLSSSVLRSEGGYVMDIFMDIASLIEAIVLSLLSCRSGLTFLVLHHELSATLIFALRGVDDDMKKEDSVPLRYASVLLSKGFVCRPKEVGVIIELQLRMVHAVDRLLTSAPHSEEFLWVLWELCSLSRTDCGRQALLAVGYFPEAVSVLMEALDTVKELDPGTLSSGISPVDLAIFHSAAEIFEVIVSDSTASSLGCWIAHAMELRSALHSSSPGSNRKDAPARLLECIDAGAVYHKYGAIGVLRYASILVSGGDMDFSSSTQLLAESMDVDNAVGDSSGGSDVLVAEDPAKNISEKSSDGVILRDSSIAQLTTALRILAFISENSVVSTALYDEGAVTVIYSVIVNCCLMLERSSNNYDYLVDEGTECNSTTDLLVERNREQSLVDLLIPSLSLLITLLQKLQETAEQHRNTKLLNALLRLHRELSPKLAASAADLSFPYIGSALSFGAVCHLIVSALACWPIFGWTPGLFHSLVANVKESYKLLALGPKETSSLLCLLNDLLPDEGIWLWKNGMPLLTAMRKFAVGTLLGPQKETDIGWYLQPGHLDTLLSQLRTQLEEIAEVVLHYAISTLVVIQDMLRVFIIRIACHRADYASVLLHPILSWIHYRLIEDSSLSDTDAYKVERLLEFLASLLEHPHAKPLLLKEEIFFWILETVLERSTTATVLEGKQLEEFKISGNYKHGSSPICWCIPVFKALKYLCAPQRPFQYHGSDNEPYSEKLKSEIFLKLLPNILNLCEVLPVGKELLACLLAFREISSCIEGQIALVSFFRLISPNTGEWERNEGNLIDNPLIKLEWRNCPPLLFCWKKLLRAINSEDGSLAYAIEAVGVLSLSILQISCDTNRLNLNRLAAVKYLLGLPYDDGSNCFPEENILYIEQMINSLSTRIKEDFQSAIFDSTVSVYQVREQAKTLLMMTQKPSNLVNVDDILSVISSDGIPLPPNVCQVDAKVHQTPEGSAEKVNELFYFGGHEDKFVWECPEILPDRLPQSSSARRKASLEGSNRRGRVDNASAENVIQSAFARGSGPPPVPPGPSRRDTFRQRKPNTSRPPSMHVDDYVARERNVDSNASPNVIAIQRVGSSGRPPSIHVDEFMARQRERQNTAAVAAGEVSTQAKRVTIRNDTINERSTKSRQLKPDLDDDLHGIDIVFDGEESEPDDKLPFPELDNTLPQTTPVLVERNSPRSIVEETESDVNGSSQFSHRAKPIVSTADETSQSEFSSRMSVSRPDVTLAREPSISSDKKYTQSGDSKNIIPSKAPNEYDSNATASTSSFQASYDKSLSIGQPQRGSRAPQNIYSQNYAQQPGNVSFTSGSQRPYDQRFVHTQPPLPPMPPPPTIAPIVSNQSSPHVHSMTDVQPLASSVFHVPSDSNYSRPIVHSPSGSGRPPPPLPPTPPFTSTSFNSPSLNISASQATVGSLSDARLSNLPASGSRMSSYPQPSLLPPMGYSRPPSVPITMFTNTPSQQLGENPSILQNLSIPQSTIQSLQSLAQLQPLQPPQLPRPPQPPQHLRPPIQQPQVHSYYQSQQQVDHAQSKVQQSSDVASQQQQDPGFSLQQFFSSPEAIQSLLSDRDKLCQLLEQHPKLMQMLQERLGQL